MIHINVLRIIVVPVDFYHYRVCSCSCASGTAPAHHGLPRFNQHKATSLQKSLIWHHAFGHLARTDEDPDTKTLILNFGRNGPEERVQLQVSDPWVGLSVLRDGQDRMYAR